VEFSEEAISLIWELSHGTPRIINTICDRALLAGFVQESFLIDVDIIKKCAQELEGYLVGGKL